MNLDFWKAAAVNTGFNLLQGFLGNRAQSGADAANQQALEDRIRKALALLSPQHLYALMQLFREGMAQTGSAGTSTALSQVSQYARGLGANVPRSLPSGLEAMSQNTYGSPLRSSMPGEVHDRAFDYAGNLAGMQSAAVTGAPYAMQQPQTGYADAVTNSVNQAYFARAMSQVPQQPGGVPYAYPYNPYGRF